MTTYDITAPIRSNMPVYEGDPGVKIEAWSAFAKGDSSNVSFLSFGAHTGTHVDAPAHFIDGARKIDALSLEILIGPARVVRVADDVTEIEGRDGYSSQTAAATMEKIARLSDESYGTRRF